MTSTASGFTVADAPFHAKSTADFAIQTCDHAVFYVHKLVLSLASTYFEEMFGIVPSPPRSPMSATLAYDLETFEVTENFQTMDCLLRMIYPGRRPTIDSPSLAGDLWKAARKYQIQVAEDIALERLRALIPNYELYMFATACHANDDEEATRGANAWLRASCGGPHEGTPPGVPYETLEDADFAYIPEMEQLSAGTYLRLLHYLLQPRRRCNFSRKDQFVASLCDAEVNVELLRTSMIMESKGSSDAFGHGEWDTILRSSDGVDFRVHRLVLKLSAADGLIQRATRVARSNKMSRYCVSIESSMLRVLLYICYPLNTIQSESVSTVIAFLRLTLEYDLTGVTAELKRQLLKMVDAHSVRLYFLGVQLGWADLTTAAARHTVGIKNILECIRGIDLLRGLAIPELEAVPASALYELLTYHRRAQDAVIGEVGRVLPAWTVQPREDAIPLAAVAALGMPCAFEHISVPVIVTGSHLIQSRLEARLSIGTSLAQLCQGSKTLGNAVRDILDDIPFKIVR
ncbi:hypothetical protein PHLGIDRAFT_480391 [Phlebiopsis gigantea 11061_1 CR5-6]|uniref:BTB domain-containing protein n=1 Tax=Phlebiopsis gigantea (strain 11061_1 CR5-6) TaxID=745531 RepID=A0A0C3RWK4_PHLG1|nr:hypothetical protein PHLGIDRAFT_480391 [Phlebiopsis gigantea 11061_1 CR5-6]